MWDDWLAPLDDVAPSIADGVQALLDGAGRVASPSFVDVKLEGGMVRVRAGVSLDDDLDVCGELAVALRAAAAHGGGGSILLLQLQGRGATVRIEVVDGTSECVKAKRTEARVKRAIAELMAGALEHAPPEVRAAQAALDRKAALELELATSNEPLRALRERALTALVAQPDGAILRVLLPAPLPVYLGKKGLSLVELPSDAKVLEVLRTRLTPGSRDPHLHYTAPLVILGRLDRLAAEPIALETLEIEAPLTLHLGAIETLHGSRNPAAIMPLVRTLERTRDDLPTWANRVAAALRTLRIDGVGAAVLPLLSAELMSNLSGMNDPSYPYALRIWSVLGAHPYRPGQEALAAIYRSHPAETIRMWAGRCLLLDGEPPKEHHWPGGMLFAAVTASVDALLATQGL